MDTSFWTNLKVSNNVKFTSAKTHRRGGFLSSMQINNRWLSLCGYKKVNVKYRKNLRELLIDQLYYEEIFYEYPNKTKTISKKSWQQKNASKIAENDILCASIDNYVEFHPDLKFNFSYYGLIIYGDESDLIEFLNSHPALHKNTKTIILPSCDEAVSLIKDGYILTLNEPTMPFRAKTKSGYIKKTSLEKVVRQVSLSPDRYEVSGYFKDRVLNRTDWYGRDTDELLWIGTSNIYFKNEHDIALFALIDPQLTKKIEKMAQDPGFDVIANLNRVRTHVDKT